LNKYKNKTKTMSAAASSAASGSRGTAGISRLTNSKKALKKNGQPGVGKVGDSSWFAEEITEVNIPLRFPGYRSNLGDKTKWTFGKENEFSKFLIKSVALELSCPGSAHVSVPDDTANSDQMPYAIRVNHFPSVAIHKAQMLKYQCYMEGSYQEKMIKNEELVAAPDMGDDEDDDEQSCLDGASEEEIKTYYLEKSLESARRRDYFVELPFPFSDTDGSEFPAFLYSKGFDLEIDWNDLGMVFDNSDKYIADVKSVSTPFNVETDQPFTPTDINVTVVFTCIRLPDERLKTLLEEYASPAGIEHKTVVSYANCYQNFQASQQHTTNQFWCTNRCNHVQ